MCQIKIFLACIFTFAFISSCKKSSSTAPSTDLQITVRDLNLATVSSVGVTIYNSNDDLLKGVNPIMSGTTDASGKVTFKNLSAKKYYYVAQKDCENTVAYGDSAALIQNHTYDVVATLGGAGTLQFVNNSITPYKIYVNSTLFITLDGAKMWTSYPIIPAQQYQIEVVGATDEKFVANVTCGGTTTTSFP